MQRPRTRRCEPTEGLAHEFIAGKLYEDRPTSSGVGQGVPHPPRLQTGRFPESERSALEALRKDKRWASDINVHFDTAQIPRSEELLSGELSFPLLPNETGVLFRDIVRLKIGSFRMPIFPTGPNKPMILYNTRVYMRLRDVSVQQSTRTYVEDRYNFEFAVEELDSLAVLLVPINDTINFRRPFDGFNNLKFDIRFLIPPIREGYNFSSLELPNDKLSVKIVQVATGAPLRLEILNDATRNIGLLGELETKVAVSITGATSNNSEFNLALNGDAFYITSVINNNTIESNLITYPQFGDNGIDPFQITGANQLKMYVLKNKISFQVRFTRISEEQTNYLLPVLQL